MLGNLNIYTNKEEHPDTIISKDFPDSFGLVSHMSFPIHWLQNTLYLIITMEHDFFITNTA